MVYYGVGLLTKQSARAGWTGVEKLVPIMADEAWSEKHLCMALTPHDLKSSETKSVLAFAYPENSHPVASAWMHKRGQRALPRVPMFVTAHSRGNISVARSGAL